MCVCVFVCVWERERDSEHIWQGLPGERESERERAKLTGVKPLNRYQTHPSIQWRQNYLHECLSYSSSYGIINHQHAEHFYYSMANKNKHRKQNSKHQKVLLLWRLRIDSRWNRPNPVIPKIRRYTRRPTVSAAEQVKYLLVRCKQKIPEYVMQRTKYSI